ncbi:hypothetical protein [Bernardetia sp.]|uniref:hypothetical protein n=1 Tax=Bernardetia sp. TaxID=1937974 RepID=UPI0025BC403F|nr:hypothetical protein [Bernardetia sp.]
MKKITSKKWISTANQKERHNRLTTILFDKQNCFEFFEENTFFEKTENGKTIILKSKPTKNTAQTNRLICIDFEKLFDFVNSNLSQKCDFVFIDYYNQEYYFIELKGNAEHMSKPYEQIKITIELFKQRANINKNSIFGIIIGGNNKIAGIGIPQVVSKRNEFIQKVGKDLFHAQNKGIMNSPFISSTDFIGS